MFHKDHVIDYHLEKKEKEKEKKKKKQMRSFCITFMWANSLSERWIHMGGCSFQMTFCKSFQQ